MNIESLKYFQMIVKEGNISGVAKKVHLSQSALSQQIQKLENDLSRKLMLRSNKGITLTSTGGIVAKFADNIIRTYDEMLSEITQDEAQNLIIKIDACVWIASYALPCTLINANKIYPSHTYELSGNSSNEILSRVANDICDIGFYCCEQDDIEYKDLNVSKVGESNLVLVAKNTPVYPDAMSVDDLLASSLIMCAEKNSISKVLLSKLASMGYKNSSLNCSMRVEEIESAKKLVSNGYGISFLPYIAVKEELYKRQFKQIQIPNLELRVNVLMLWKSDCPSYVLDFIRWFRSFGRESFC